MLNITKSDTLHSEHLKKPTNILQQEEIKTTINPVVVMETKESHHDLKDPPSKLGLPTENHVRNVVSLHRFYDCCMTLRKTIVIYSLLACALKLLIISAIFSLPAKPWKHILVLSVGAVCQLASVLLKPCDWWHWWLYVNNTPTMIISWVLNVIAVCSSCYFFKEIFKSSSDQYDSEGSLLPTSHPYCISFKKIFCHIVVMQSCIFELISVFVLGTIDLGTGPIRKNPSC